MFCFLGEWTTEGEDNRRSGQHEWRTAGWECGERSVRGEREVERGGHWEERTATMVDRAVYTFKRALLIKRVVFI